jgi:hypothetical protein
MGRVLDQGPAASKVSRRHSTYLEVACMVLEYAENTRECTLLRTAYSFTCWAATNITKASTQPFYSAFFAVCVVLSVKGLG